MNKKKQKSFNWYGLSQRFSIRKYHVGAVSVLLGLALVSNLMTSQVYASETIEPDISVETTVVDESSLSLATDMMESVATTLPSSEENNVSTESEITATLVETDSQGVELPQDSSSESIPVAVEPEKHKSMTDILEKAKEELSDTPKAIDNLKTIVEMYPDGFKYSEKIQWVKGVTAPKESEFKIINEYGFEPSYTYYTVEDDKGNTGNWYDINKKFNQAHDQNLCYSAVSGNMLHWWLNVNKEYVDRYLAIYPAQDKGTYNGKTITTLDAYLNSYKNQDESKIFEDFTSYFKWRRNGGWTDSINDFFINGYKPNFTMYANSESTWNKDNLDNRGGYFSEVFGGEILSTRDMANHKESFNRLLKQYLNNEQAVGVAFRFGNTRGPLHIISLWGAEFDQDGYVNAIYVTDSDDGRSTYETIDGEKNVKKGLFRYHVTYDGGNGRPRISATTKPTADTGGYVDYLYGLKSGKETWQAFFEKEEVKQKEAALKAKQNSSTPLSSEPKESVNPASEVLAEATKDTEENHDKEIVGKQDENIAKERSERTKRSTGVENVGGASFRNVTSQPGETSSASTSSSTNRVEAGTANATENPTTSRAEIESNNKKDKLNRLKNELELNWQKVENNKNAFTIDEFSASSDKMEFLVKKFTEEIEKATEENLELTFNQLYTLASTFVETFGTPLARPNSIKAITESYNQKKSELQESDYLSKRLDALKLEAEEAINKAEHKVDVEDLKDKYVTRINGLSLSTENTERLNEKKDKALTKLMSLLETKWKEVEAKDDLRTLDESLKVLDIKNNLIKVIQKEIVEASSMISLDEKIRNWEFNIPDIETLFAIEEPKIKPKAIKEIEDLYKLQSKKLAKDFISLPLLEELKDEAILAIKEANHESEIESQKRIYKDRLSKIDFSEQYKSINELVNEASVLSSAISDSISITNESKKEAQKIILSVLDSFTNTVTSMTNTDHLLELLNKAKSNIHHVTLRLDLESIISKFDALTASPEKLDSSFDIENPLINKLGRDLKLIYRSQTRVFGDGSDLTYLNFLEKDSDNNKAIIKSIENYTYETISETIINDLKDNLKAGKEVHKINDILNALYTENKSYVSELINKYDGFGIKTPVVPKGKLDNIVNLFNKHINTWKSLIPKLDELNERVKENNDLSVEEAKQVLGLVSAPPKEEKPNQPEHDMSKEDNASHVPTPVPPKVEVPSAPEASEKPQGEVDKGKDTPKAPKEESRPRPETPSDKPKENEGNSVIPTPVPPKVEVPSTPEVSEKPQGEDDKGKDTPKTPKEESRPRPETPSDKPKENEGNSVIPTPVPPKVETPSTPEVSEKPQGEVDKGKDTPKTPKEESRPRPETPSDKPKENEGNSVIPTPVPPKVEVPSTPEASEKPQGEVDKGHEAPKTPKDETVPTPETPSDKPKENEGNSVIPTPVPPKVEVPSTPEASEKPQGEVDKGKEAPKAPKDETVPTPETPSDKPKENEGNSVIPTPVPPKVEAPSTPEVSEKPQGEADKGHEAPKTPKEESKPRPETPSDKPKENEGNSVIPTPVPPKVEVPSTPEASEKPQGEVDKGKDTPKTPKEESRPRPETPSDKPKENEGNSVIPTPVPPKVEVPSTPEASEKPQGEVDKGKDTPKTPKEESKPRPETPSDKPKENEGHGTTPAPLPPKSKASQTEPKASEKPQGDTETKSPETRTKEQDKPSRPLAQSNNGGTIVSQSPSTAKNEKSTVDTGKTIDSSQTKSDVKKETTSSETKKTPNESSTVSKNDSSISEQVETSAAQSESDVSEKKGHSFNYLMLLPLLLVLPIVALKKRLK
ncbi:IdeS/Mac family cysteine endopeptidase [Streptococcus fryi]